MTTALIVGGSIAGMCAARALKPVVDRVVVLDRDAWPETPGLRKGSPQARHAHVLLRRGMLALEEAFPGFVGRMEAAGAQRLDLGTSFAVLRRWGWAPRVRTDLHTLWASRVLVEHTVRSLLQQVPGVELREGAAVSGLVFEGGAVRGVTLADGQALDADLVVDCTGRASAAADWLEAQGLPRPKDETVNPQGAYATRWFQAPNPWPEAWWWRGMLVEGSTPEQNTSAVLIPIEGDRFIITAWGLNGFEPPTDAQGFLKHVDGLPTPVLGELVRASTPLTEVMTHRGLINRFRHFESVDAPPGFVATGDAVCCFNPIYGQGMTVGALGGALLGQVARKGLDARLPRRFFRAQAMMLMEPWIFATNSDLQWPNAVGERSLRVRLAGPLMRLLVESIHNDPAVYRRAAGTAQMVQSALALMAPGVLGRAMVGAIRRRARGFSTGGTYPAPVGPAFERVH